MPVILVVYDARTDVAYWLHIQDHFAAEESRDILRLRGTLTARLPLANRLDPVALQGIAGLKNKVYRQLQGGKSHDD